eukprot:2194078-Rhodomonas_salina.1
MGESSGCKREAHVKSMTPEGFITGYGDRGHDSVAAMGKDKTGPTQGIICGQGRDKKRSAHQMLWCGTLRIRCVGRRRRCVPLGENAFRRILRRRDDEKPPFACGPDAFVFLINISLPCTVFFAVVVVDVENLRIGRQKDSPREQLHSQQSVFVGSSSQVTSHQWASTEKWDRGQRMTPREKTTASRRREGKRTDTHAIENRLTRRRPSSLYR